MYIEQELPKPAPTSSHQHTYAATIAPSDPHSLALTQASLRLSSEGKECMKETLFIRKIYSGHVIVWCKWNVLENVAILRNFICICKNRDKTDLTSNFLTNEK